MKKASRYKNRKKNKSRKSKPKQALILAPIQPPIPIKSPEKLGFFKKGKIEKIIGLLVLIFSATSLGYFIYDRYKPQHQKFEEENIKQGTVKFPAIPVLDTSKGSETRTVLNDKLFYVDTNTYHYPMIKGILLRNLDSISQKHSIFFELGTNKLGVPLPQLLDGYDIFSAFGGGQCSSTELGVIIKGDRLYFSCDFIDLRTENEIGDMEYNHWKIYKGEYMDYHEDDDRFEVFDKAGNVAFSIANVGSPGEILIRIEGYFVSPNSVLIVNGQTPDIALCLSKSDSNWLSEAKIEIKKIKSAFPNKNN